MEKLIYKNPILQFDFSDPDVIRTGDDFYMVASSFNYVPGVPVLHSKNLVEWELVNYVYDKIPFERFSSVCHGDGAWAPAIRYHNGLYYCIIPFPDEGIYISCTDDPKGKWSDLWCLIEGKGIIDPCPIWTDDGKCYLAVGFAKSRIGFNSCIGIYEVTPDLKEKITDYKIVYDGHDNNPTIEGPKFNTRNGYYYIMCPAGSVKGGWQIALRSKNIYGPYESKVVLMQNGTKVNGPHQGALVDIDDNDNWAFIHFQDMWAYGRIVHLQPVKFYNDWPLCGLVTDNLLGGAPVEFGEYPVNIKTDKFVPLSDNFKGEKLSLIWQTQANQKDSWFKVNDGLTLNCVEDDNLPLHLLPQLLTMKVGALEFDCYVSFDLNLTNNDEVGFTVMGEDYTYVCIKVIDNQKYLMVKEGSFNSEEQILHKEPYNENQVKFSLSVRNESIYDMKYQYFVNDKPIDFIFYAKAGRWVGTTYGIYARGVNGNGFAYTKEFLTKKIK